MTHAEKLKRWRAALKRLNLNPREVAERIEVHKGTAYAWNCGYVSVPEHRLEQVEKLK